MWKHDFLGQPIVVGSWVASSGKGNVACEYGMVLYHVIDIVKGKLKLRRLTVSYLDHSRAKASFADVMITNPNKYAVVSPPEKVVALFDRVVDGDVTQADHVLVGKWLHGKLEGLF